MNITLKSLNDKLSNLLNKYDSFYDSSFKLISEHEDMLAKSIELDKKLDIFLKNIPDQFVDDKVFDNTNKDYKRLRFIELLKRYGLDYLSGYQLTIVSLLCVKNDPIASISVRELPKKTFKDIYIHSLNPYFKKDLLAELFNESEIEFIKLNVKRLNEKWSF